MNCYQSESHRHTACVVVSIYAVVLFANETLPNRDAPVDIVFSEVLQLAYFHSFSVRFQIPREASEMCG